MKILVIGTEIIGSIYSWQLSKIGHKIIHLVRKDQKKNINKQGSIRCLDMRSGKDSMYYC